MVRFSQYFDDLSRHKKHLIVCVFAVFVGLAGLWSLPVLDRDEARFAQATAQMLETGDYVSIKFLDQERNKKPVGIHWLQAASVDLFSDVTRREIWAYRIPSFIAMIVAVYFTMLIGELLFNTRTGFYAALLFASAPLVAAEATIAKTDAVLLATICIAQWALATIFIAKKSSLAVSAIFWSAVGASILIKGPIGPMVIGLCIAALFFSKRISTSIKFLNPWAGLIIVFLMVIPWALSINTATEGRFFADAVGGDFLGKIGSAKEQHAGPPGYHVALLSVLFWPAVILLIPGLYRLIMQRDDHNWHFLFAWLVPAWVIFEISGTKLPHYTLPLYPALAIIAATTLDKWGEVTKVWVLKTGIALYLIIGLLFAAAIPITGYLYNGDGVTFLALFASALILCSALGVAFLFAKDQPAEGAIAASVLAAAVAWVMMNVTLPALDQLRVSPRIATAIKAIGHHTISNDAPPSFLTGYYEPSLIFHLGSQTKLGSGAAAAAYISNTPGAVAVVEGRAMDDFLDQLDRGSGHIRLHTIIDGFNYSKGDRISVSIYVNTNE